MLVAEKPLKSYLQKYFGFDKFKGEQEEIVASVLAGKDTFVIMPTGGEVDVLSASISHYGWDGGCRFAIDCLDEESGRCNAWI